MNGAEAAVVGVLLGGVRVAGAEQETGLGLPLLPKALRGLELDVGDGVAPVGEHATTADGGKLCRVSDGDESPVVAFDEVDEAGEVVGRGHAGFVEDDGRAGGPGVWRCAGGG